MNCQVAEVMLFESWAAPRTMVSRSWRSAVLTLTRPETAATMMTITVIESISLRPSRRGMGGKGPKFDCSAMERLGSKRGDAESAEENAENTNRNSPRDLRVLRVSALRGMVLF